MLEGVSVIRNKTTLLGCLAALLAGCTDDATTAPALPKAEVEILVDDAGVPHIYAKDDEDLFYGYGYQLATDRMLQLEMFRRFAHGRLAEVLGPEGFGAAGANALIDDHFARIFDWKKWGKADAELMARDEPEHYKLTSAWVAGINQRIAEIHGGQAPVPFGFSELGFSPEAWAPDDVYIVQKMAGFGLDQTIDGEVFVTFVKQLAPAALDAIQLFKPARQVFTMPEDERPGATGQLSLGGDGELACRGGEFTPEMAKGLEKLAHIHDMKALGSNNWAVDGRHTDNGMPIVAGDPHLGYSFSGTTYALHLNSADAGGSFQVTGFSFVGAPGIFAGHNEHVAYTETSAFSDVMDMWAVEIVDGKAKIGGQLVETTTREEIIHVKGGADDVITVTEVPGYGVIMPYDLVGSPISIAGEGKEILVGWTGFKARPARYFRELMRVKNVDEFETAVGRMGEMSYNFVAADAQAISYKVGVEVPARNLPAEGREPWLAMDGNDPEAIWPAGQFLSDDQKPHSRGATRGFLVTANNDPFGFTGDGRVDNDPWYYGALFPPGWRAGRIDEEITRLADEGPITPEAMQALQMDVHENMADDFVPVLAEAWAAVGTDPDLAEFAGREDLATLVELLTVDWDRQMKRDSAGALAFHAFAHLATRQVLEDDLNPLLFRIVLSRVPIYLLKIGALALKGEYPNGADAMQEGRDRIVLLALDATAAWLTEKFGGVDPALYAYRDMRVTDLDHAYGRGMPIDEIPTDGGESTVNVAQSTFLDGAEIADQWRSDWGPIERQVMGFDAEGRPYSTANFALGNVADPESPHFDDALSGWIEGDYRKLLFDRADVETKAESRVVLSPR
jgi:penicillin G amidase